MRNGIFELFNVPLIERIICDLGSSVYRAENIWSTVRNQPEIRPDD